MHVAGPQAQAEQPVADLAHRFGNDPLMEASLFTVGEDGATTPQCDAETCTFASPVAGTYYVNLKAYSTFSGVSLKGDYTTASSNTAPVANFTFTTSGLTATFTDTSTDAQNNIASRSWNFGDGTTSTSAAG